MMLACKRCGHVWDYHGKNDYRASCPHCLTTVRIVAGKRQYLEAIGEAAVEMGEA